MNPRNKEQLDEMDPEKRARVEAIIARHHTPEAEARHRGAIEAVAREVRETGGIRTSSGLHKVKAPGAAADEAAFSLVTVGAALRRHRKAAGKSLEALAGESGMDQGMLSRIERGAVANPTVGTLARVAAALGVRITIGVEGDDPGRDLGTAEVRQLIQIAEFIGYETAMRRLLDARPAVDAPTNPNPEMRLRTAK